MKKFLLVAITALTIVGLTACGSKKKKNATTTENTTTENINGHGNRITNDTKPAFNGQKMAPRDAKTAVNNIYNASANAVDNIRSARITASLNGSLNGENIKGQS